VLDTVLARPGFHLDWLTLTVSLTLNLSLNPDPVAVTRSNGSSEAGEGGGWPGAAQRQALAEPVHGVRCSASTCCCRL